MSRSTNRPGSGIACGARTSTDLTTALDQQTATSEILRVIASSPTDLEPVARAIADSAGRFCDCAYSAVFRFDGKLMHWVAARGASGEQQEALRSVWPRPPGRDTLLPAVRMPNVGNFVSIYRSPAR